MPMHVSVAKQDTIEFIEQTQVSPLITKGVAKVLYIGDNRNGTSISEESATEMGRKLPGSPVVGYYREDLQDFEEHSRTIEITTDKFEILDLTKPYGFVPTDSKIWFQKFVDEDGVERKYLCCDVYIWTTAYPESKRVFEKGNNQSMELEPDSIKGAWAKSANSQGRIFIINEALIEKLCILGEDFEPCFESAQIQKEFALQLNNEIEQLKASLFALVNEVKDALVEGGAKMEFNASDPKEQLEVTEEQLSPPVENDSNFKKKEEDNEDNSNKEKDPDSDNKQDDDNDEEDDGKKKKSYSLEEIPEYVALNAQYSAIVEEKSHLEAKVSELETEIASLKQFKLEAERVEKQAKIDEFFMLSDDDKADVIANIDNYSLDDIEAKLSVICFRNKVSFAPVQSEEEGNQPTATTFSLNNLEDTSRTNDAPEWVQSVLRIQNEEE